MERFGLYAGGRNDTVLRVNLDGNIGSAWVDREENPKFEVIVGEISHACLVMSKFRKEYSWISLLSEYYSDPLSRFNRHTFKKERNGFQIEKLKGRLPNRKDR